MKLDLGDSINHVLYKSVFAPSASRVYSYDIYEHIAAQFNTITDSSRIILYEFGVLWN